MPKRRGHGEGSIYQDNRGRWIAEIDLGRNADGKRTRRKRISGTRREAQARLRDLQRDSAANLDLDGANVTVNDLLDRVIDHVCAKGRQPRTIDNYRWAASLLRPALGPRKARELTALDVEQHLGNLATGRNLSSSSLRRVLGTLRQALDEGVRLDWLQRNVAAVARCPDSHTRSRQALALEQVRSLVAAVEGTRLHVPVLLGITCGLRPGELLGLTWDNLDLASEPSTLTVTHSLKQDSSGTYLGDLKTGASRRTVALTDLCATVLRSHRAWQAEQRLAAGRRWQADGFVFTNDTGGPWDKRNFRREFYKAARRAGIGAVPPYVMRHTAVTLLSHEGVRAEEIADLMGHADTRMVERVYRTRPAVVDVGRSSMTRLVGPRGA